MKYKLFFLGVVSAAMLPFAYADSNVAVVDIKSIAESSAEMKALNKNLEDKFKPMQEALMKKDQAFRDKAEKFKADSLTMSKGDREKMEAGLQKEQTQLRDEQSKFQREFFQAQNTGYQNFIGKLKSSVAQIAKDKGYQLVLQKNEAIALYSADSVDITKLVKDSFK